MICAESNCKVVERLLPVTDYALGETLESGQAFRWRAAGDGWEGVIAGRWVHLRAVPGGIRAMTIAGDRGGESGAGWEWLDSYLQTGVDWEAVVASFPEDEPMRAAVAACRGLRLLRQEPWECLASFILSSTKQIVQIRQIVNLLCERHGSPVAVPAGHEPAFAFPTAGQLAALDESDLRACKMGFRAPYLLGTARMVADGTVDLGRIAELGSEQAREELLRFPGVGGKIADCVRLFAYGFQDAFPVDVWVRKALQQLYFPRRRVSARRIERFAATHFGEHAGYAQQYLFHYMRTRVGRDGG